MTIATPHVHASSSTGKITVLDAFPPRDGTAVDGVEYNVGSVADKATVEAVLTGETTCVFHLAAVVSEEAERDWGKGMEVNFDGARTICERAASLGTRPVVAFTSSLAVFGGEVVKNCTEDSAVMPQSSYGVEKAMCELLPSDLHRRSSISARLLRLPTVSVRPGLPNVAASGFVSGIVREPLSGKEAVLPVDEDLELWIQSPRNALANLVRASLVPHEKMVDKHGRPRCVVTVPGLTVTSRALIDAMVLVGGGDVGLVRRERDPKVEAIVASWPGRIDTPWATILGFKADASVEEVVRAFVEDDLKG